MKVGLSFPSSFINRSEIDCSIVSIQSFSFLIINPQMTNNPRPTKSSDSRGNNLILVSNNSNNSECPANMLFLRSSSRNQLDYPLQLTHSLSRKSRNRDSEERDELKSKGRSQSKKEAQNKPLNYASQCLEYQKYIFDDKIRLIIQRMAILAYQSFRQKSNHEFLTFFIERMLCTLAKKLLLNKFELLFLEYMLEETKWKYDSSLISTFSYEFKPVVYIYQSQNSNSMVRNLQIYLLFCSYCAKISLNDSDRNEAYSIFLKEINPKFKERYQEWIQATGFTKKMINTKMFNVIFKRLTSFQEKEKDNFENYNLIVEEILEISPAYNPDKEKRKKKIKTQDIPAEEVMQEPINVQQAPLNSILQQNSSHQIPVIGLRKKRTSFLSNDPDNYYRRNS